MKSRRPLFGWLSSRSGRLRRAFRTAVRLMPETGDVDDFVQAVAKHRSRRVVTMAQDLGLGSPTGYWISTAGADYVVYPFDSTEDQRAMIICHELAHMLLEHQPPDGQLDLDVVAPSIAPSVAARFLNRHGFDDAREADAEGMATHLTAELDRRANRHRLARDNISARLR